ncbi:calcium-activated chloride channel-domain-containing protein [Ochromonadaceae sp. CCMP2298]|nr:calcium-activated chloride channel-domain-containing protein [Ochromonadaceae sp. CCMP2298]
MTVRPSDWERPQDYEFCMVFPVQQRDFTEKGKGYVKILRKLGFELYAFFGIREEKEIFVLVRTPIDKLRAFADSVDFKLKMNAVEIQKALEAGNEESGIAPIFIDHRPDITHMTPFQHIYCKYSNAADEKLYQFDDGLPHCFSEIVRLKLAALIVESRPADGSQNLKIRRYIRSGWLLACYPLHDKKKADELMHEWRKYPLQKLPLDRFKNYFGQKVGMYFAFLDHFAISLVLPAIVGLPLQIAVFATGNYSAEFLPYFALLIALWAVTTLELWKRKERGIALEWGSIDFEQTEVDRPDFRGETITSFIDGTKVKFFPSKTRAAYGQQSSLVVISLIALTVGVVASIYILRSKLAHTSLKDKAQIIASVANAVSIQTLNYVYYFLATALSERENHRTDTEFEDSMIIKLFLFQFVNSYASFYYLAFAAEWIGECHGDGCMKTLSLNVGVIYGVNLFFGNFLELLLPYLSYRYKYKKESEASKDDMSVPEREYLLDKVWDRDRVRVPPFPLPTRTRQPPV